MRNNLIGISGKMGSGKDEVFKIIQELTSNKFQNRKFADQLKDTVCMWIGCSREQLEDRDFKESPLGEMWDHYVVTSSYGAPDEIYLEDPGMVHSRKRQMTPRLMLQLLGTEAGREIIHPNIWVNALFADFRPLDPEKAFSNGDVLDYTDCTFPNWVITDCRFPNEAEAIMERVGIVIRISRGYGNTGTHASETALDGCTFDYDIDNNGTLDNLKKNVEWILKTEGII
jgi:hypothetical protein